jgi:hypothetical protein
MAKKNGFRDFGHLGPHQMAKWIVADGQRARPAKPFSTVRRVARAAAGAIAGGVANSLRRHATSKSRCGGD